MSKTTPGPWLAERSAETLIMQVVAPTAPRSKRVVARLGGADVRDGNARLIAAAPDMLAAGKLCPDRADFGTTNAYADAVDAWWRNEMLPAIAKAEGRS